MKIIQLLLNGAAIIKSDIFEDNRGFFTRLFCQKELSKLHNSKSIDQINYSFTKKKGTIRGLHFQKNPFEEIKIVRCLKGKIFDVIVDMRKNSKTYLKWHGEILSENNHKMLYVPKGFAHGFQTLEDDCMTIYFNNEFYNPQAELGIKFDDKLLNIKWPIKMTAISDKDLNFESLNDISIVH
ncbi:MAG: dTDP-4-dehydrorhamnose 3,5-epimerase [Candidatus Anoxychlamydiales bacterium]|nr:dTDP-4-dehydrorhamnose 3,5-epimerase [Candidatus Anoxychlamydiales bacterium]